MNRLMAPKAGGRKRAMTGFNHGRQCLDGAGAGVSAFRVMNNGCFCVQRTNGSRDANIAGVRALVPT